MIDRVFTVMLFASWTLVYCVERVVGKVEGFLERREP